MHRTAMLRNFYGLALIDELFTDETGSRDQYTEEGVVSASQREKINMSWCFQILQNP